MAKILRDLLDADEPMFSLALRQLERASGEQGRDAQLIGEIALKMRASIQALGLDPNDTSERELYATQLARLQRDNARLARLVGGTDPDDPAHIVPLLIKQIGELNVTKTCWVLKRSVAKKLLKMMPPKQLMKQLGYRSVDSLLKHESIDELYTALRFSEGEKWLDSFNELFLSVTPSDFESREMVFLVMDHEKYVSLAESFVKNKLHNIVHSKEMGTIAVVPMRAERVPGVALTSMLLLLHYLNEVRLYSAFFKLKQVAGNFGEVVVKTLKDDPGDASQMAGQYVHWRVIQRYFGSVSSESYPEAFKPHVQPEDLYWRKAEELLVVIDPEMAFWAGLDYVGKLYNGVPLTFNLIDLTLSYSNNRTYKTAYSCHFRESLWNELFIRYMGANYLTKQVLDRLDTTMIAPEERLL